MEITLNKLLCWKNCASTNSGDLDEKTRDEHIRRRKAFFLQFIRILPGYILMLDVGVSTTWTSPSLPHLTSEDSEFPVTINQSIWLVSIGSIGNLIGYAIVALIVNRIGRKYTIFLGGLTLLLYRILLRMANSFVVLLIAQLISSIGNFFVIPTLSFYIGETVEETIRGGFLVANKICVNIGAFLVVVAGALLPYNTMNLVMILLPFLGLVMFPLTIESPYFLLMKGREKEAVDTLMKLSGRKKLAKVMVDIERMKNAIAQCQNSQKSSLRELFCDKGCRKALIIYLLICNTYNLSGYLAIQAYAQEIFSNSGSSLTPEYCVIIMTGIQIFAGLSASQIVDQWGRRPTVLISGVLSSLSLIIVGLFFFLKVVIEVDVSSINWLPLAGLIAFTFSCNTGLSTIMYVYRGELLSVKVKAVANMIVAIVGAIVSFIVKTLLPLVNRSVGIYASFWIFAICCLLGSITIFCYAPETKDKNLEEILELFRNKKPNVKKTWT